MSDDELKAAAERQKFGLYSLSEEAKWAPQEHERELKDLKLLARAYIARLTADEQQAREDAEPITDEWLRSLGFYHEGNELRADFGNNCGSCIIVGREMLVCVGFYTGSHTSLVRTRVETRGQLRKLIEALKGGER